MQKFRNIFFPGEPGWLVAVQVGVVVLAILYFGGHFAAILAGRLVP